MPLDDKTVGLLMDALTQAFTSAAESKLKLAAFEETLREEEPGTHKAYLRKIEKLSNDLGPLLNAAALDSLRTKLLQP